jgi:hypothetical protein
MASRPERVAGQRRDRRRAEEVRRRGRGVGVGDAEGLRAIDLATEARDLAADDVGVADGRRAPWARRRRAPQDGLSAGDVADLPAPGAPEMGACPPPITLAA